ncbi:MAG: hypothetical protein JWM02_1317 [Frankiales bacterium]|nr:hypothetical protein [Frankiales bacterium]
MNKLFADWHAEVGIALAGDVLKAREVGANDVVGGLTGAQVLDLIAIAHPQGQSADRGIWFRDAIKAADNTFRMRDNDREAAVLAGACLWEILDGDQDEDRLSTLAGYGCALAGLLGWVPLVPDLTSYAEHRLSTLAEQRRALALPPEAPKIQIWSKQTATAIAAAMPAETGITLETVSTAFAKFATYVQLGFDKTLEQVDEVSRWAERAIDICAEEGNYVGWLLSGASNTLDRPWATLAAPITAVLAARELAACTTLLPAPMHADAFLDQLLAATPFSDQPEAVALEPLIAPEPVSFLIASLPNGVDDPQRQARHSLRQAMMLRAWEALA